MARVCLLRLGHVCLLRLSHGVFLTSLPSVHHQKLAEVNRPGPLTLPARGRRYTRLIPARGGLEGGEDGEEPIFAKHLVSRIPLLVHWGFLWHIISLGFLSRQTLYHPPFSPWFDNGFPSERGISGSIG